MKELKNKLNEAIENLYDFFEKEGQNRDIGSFLHSSILMFGDEETIQKITVDIEGFIDRNNKTKRTYEEIISFAKEKFQNDEVLTLFQEWMLISMGIDNGELLYSHPADKQKIDKFIVECYRYNITTDVLKDIMDYIRATFYETEIDDIAEQILDKLQLLKTYEQSKQS